MRESHDRVGRRGRAGGRMSGVRMLTVTTALLVMLFVPSGGYAVHDLGLSELNTTAPQIANTKDDSGPGAPYDWESIFDSSGNRILTTEPRLLATDFSADYATPDPSYFSESNKDIDNVTTWDCKSVNHPTPKDEITNAYAALFENTANGHVIL